MRRANRHDERPFLSVITWPEGYDREGLARLIAQISGLDFATLRLRLGQHPPCAIGPVDRGAAQRAVDVIIRVDGDAFAPTLAEMAAIGPTFRIKSMRLTPEGHLDVDLWRGLSTTLRPEQIRILVRGMLKETVREKPDTPPRPGRQLIYASGGARSHLGRALTMVGRASSYASDYFSAGNSGAQVSVRTINQLDIHTSDRSVYRVVGRKFDFEILGDMRRHRSDRENMDALCELLAHLSPDEIVDEYFAMWKPPPGYHRLRVPGDRSNEDRKFTFYSRWAALMYRHILDDDGIDR